VKDLHGINLTKLTGPGTTDVQGKSSNGNDPKFRNKITPGSAPILFQCSSSFRPENAKIAEVVRCWMFSEPSFGLFAIFDGKV
jgi:hypothetical protein